MITRLFSLPQTEDITIPLSSGVRSVLIEWGRSPPDTETVVLNAIDVAEILRSGAPVITAEGLTIRAVETRDKSRLTPEYRAAVERSGIKDPFGALDRGDAKWVSGGWDLVHLVSS